MNMYEVALGCAIGCAMTEEEKPSIGTQKYYNPTGLKYVDEYERRARKVSAEINARHNAMKDFCKQVEMRYYND